MKPTKYLVASVVITAITATGIILGIAVERGAIPGRQVISAIAQRLPMDTSKKPQLSVPDSVLKKLSLFVLAGQSNMVGHGTVRPTDRKPIPGVWLFGNDYRWKPARAPLDDPANQVDLVSRDLRVGVGPGLFFAKRLRALQKDRMIGVIPCAKGGSALSEWQPHRSDTTLYGSCLKRIRAASLFGSLEGILFYQGETDALSKTENVSIQPYQWRRLFESIIHTLRKDVRNPSLAVVFAQIGSFRGSPSRFPNWEVVRQQQESVNIPKARMVETDGLPLQDRVHLSTKGVKYVGRRMAKAWIGLMSKPEDAGRKMGAHGTASRGTDEAPQWHGDQRTESSLGQSTKKRY